MNFRSLRAAMLAALFSVGLVLPALAQWQVPNYAIPIGRGSGTGFKSVSPGTAGYFLGSAGASADPTFQGFLQSGTGAVTRTWQDKVQVQVDVKDFGAVADGSTNNATAIQAAIDAVNAAGGGIVYFPPGSSCYRYGTALQLKANVTLTGGGSLSSCLEANNVNGLEINFTTGYGNVGIDNLYLKGVNASTTRFGIRSPGTTSSADITYGISIRNSLISTFPVGISLASVRNVTIDRTWVQNVDKGIQILGVAYNVNLVNGTEVVKAAGGGGYVTSVGMEVAAVTYTTGGTLAPEAVTTSGGTKIFGFDTCVLLTQAIYVSIDQTDIGGCANVGIQFATISNGLTITKSYVELVGTAATQGIYGTGLGSTIATQVNIAENSLIGSGTSAANGVQINGAANQNQNNVNIVRNYFSGWTTNDIRANNPGSMNISNNRCASSGVPTNSISIGTRVSGAVIARDNVCDKDIAVATASDLTNGYVRLENNIVNATTQQVASWNVESAAAQYMTFAGPATSRKTYTLPNADSTLATLAGSETFTNKTLTSPVITGATLGASTLGITGKITPSQITADQNDYAPTGLSTAAVIRISSDAARNITGLSAGADGDIKIVENVGSFSITLKDESASSSAANRFALTSDQILSADSVVILKYDGTAARWRAAGGGGSTFLDSLFTLQDNSDTTKQFQLQLSGITTGNTRTWTVPDSSDTFVGLAATQELTNKTLTSAVAKGTWTQNGSTQWTVNSGSAPQGLWIHGPTGTWDPTDTNQTQVMTSSAGLGVLVSSRSSTDSSPAFMAIGYGGTGGGFRGGATGGTEASPTAVGGDALLAYMGGHGHNGTSVVGTKALLAFKSLGGWSGSNNGTYITLETVPSGSTTRAEAVRVHGSTGVSVATATDPGAGALLTNTFVQAKTYLQSGTKLRATGAAPALSSCGTTPAIEGSDLSGTVTMGTGSPTSCTITFNAAYASAPRCSVTWRTNIASMQYTVSTTAITLTQTATSSNLVDYICTARSGG